MALTIMKRIRFSAGHRLFGHGGKCEFFHGHNYVAEIYVSAAGDEVDDVGRIIDFKDLKHRLKGWIDDNWDHGFLINEADSNAIEAIQVSQPNKYYTLPYNPTAENIARYLLDEVCPRELAGTNAVATRVVIWETVDSCAEASLDQSIIDEMAISSSARVEIG
jgi:6-pyruvoyltetrahydropterin/6-carboxytetrahydropterin synthase